MEPVTKVVDVCTCVLNLLGRMVPDQEICIAIAFIMVHAIVNAHDSQQGL
jgi:hypothetical protein